MNADEFEWLTGEELLTTFAGKHGFGLQFCSVCGSTLCGLVGDTVHGITLGCVNGDPELEIGRHIFVGSKAAWEVIPDGVTTFSAEPPDGPERP